MIGRIQDRSSFVRLRREGTHIRSGPLSCTMVCDVSLSGPRVGYALGLSVGTAVKRNRLRRRLRVLVKDHASALPPGLFVFGASARACDLAFSDLSTHLDRLVTAVVQRSHGGPR